MAKVGTVFLVGAGPGDPDLLTLRAARLIEGAQIVVHDGLVDPLILAMANPGAELVSVAKSRARHTLPQDAINALLVQLEAGLKTADTLIDQPADMLHDIAAGFPDEKQMVGQVPLPGPRGLAFIFAAIPLGQG